MTRKSAKSKKSKGHPKRRRSATPKSAPVVVSAPALPLLPALTQTSLLERYRQRTALGRFAQIGSLALITLAIGAGLLMSITTLQRQNSVAASATPRLGGLYARLDKDRTAIADLEDSQKSDGLSVIDVAGLRATLLSIHADLEAGDSTTARKQLAALENLLPKSKLRLQQAAASAAQSAASAALAAAATGSSAATDPGMNVPILLYHHPPSDFTYQMELLQQRGYTTITLDQLALALVKRSALPAKPVVITFDDGFADQQGAADYLTAHQMKATFYIIDGGSASQYCIGAGRQPGNCGDAYFSWDQIRDLDHNPLFTIAAHTVDHLELSKQSREVQAFQIIEGKHQLEQQIGHQVYSFAYPYGEFNADSLALVRQAGFTTAVTTAPGTTQMASTLLTLRRIRATYDLP